MLWEQMYEFLKSWFIFPGLKLELMFVSVGLAVAFGAIWIVGQWPPLVKKPWLWVVAVSSAFLGLLAVVFVQIPLQYSTGKVLTSFWNADVLNSWLFLVAIPQILLSGLVQEGAKMVPVVLWWWRVGKNIDPKLGLIIGAAAGAGFGIFEAFWVHANVFSSGWTFQSIQADGFLGIAPFWERFFAVAFHIAVSALAGYGLARGKGWQYYLIAAVIHGLLNYGAVFWQKGYFNVVRLEVYAAVIAVILTAVVIWLRWRKTEEMPAAPVGPAEPPEPEQPAEVVH